MIILKEQVAAQTFKIIPRSTTADTLILEEEGSETSNSYGITLVTGANDYYSTITEALTLREGFFYTMTVKNGSDIIYKDRVYCTNQTITDYTINNNEYTQQTSDNKFIIIS